MNVLLRPVGRKAGGPRLLRSWCGSASYPRSRSGGQGLERVGGHLPLATLPRRSACRTCCAGEPLHLQIRDAGGLPCREVTDVSRPGFRTSTCRSPSFNSCAPPWPGSAMTRAQATRPTAHPTQSAVTADGRSEWRSRGLRLYVAGFCRCSVAAGCTQCDGQSVSAIASAPLTDLVGIVPYGIGICTVYTAPVLVA